MATNNPFLNGGINSNSSSSTNIKVNNIKSNAFGNIAVPLSSLPDISISSIANNQQLVYDSTLSQWKNETVFNDNVFVCIN